MPELDALQNPPSEQEPVQPALGVWPSVNGSPAQLVLVSTPIGNLGDVTSRAISALRLADIVLCEDSRVTQRLLFALGLKARLESFHDHNEESRTPRLLEAMRRGQKYALVSDAGTPLMSDPGFRLVRAAVAEGFGVTALPGPNAAVTALTLSGLPPHPYLFLGFPPPRGGARRTAFAALRAAEAAGLSASMIWYESPHRVAEMLADLQTVFGDRPAALARELTKHFEQVRRGPLSALIAGVEADPPRGEICVVLGPHDPEAEGQPAFDLDARLRDELTRTRLKEAVAQVAAETGLPRRQVYARALALSGETEA
ncbi:16S rRNA (cytidine(1402)-2'-O)-methyltransferase [Acidisoma cellulosilytica]|uniref:Ribosomal RNA small subunit methyltransferase I n=1 Tax=Acidisoma cellulosilyticum TaxID=2802395 RepID=A0A963Z3P2_9PROT|nr:16S rRNA (cytidine(1402)-2'-O)-methyltransferase [Acidisoma cellulosilyticum]MCB8882310.1 16S rRNA (cytidine(1402)-2'-O)-methyltransferase [Acidisoma cellulosilyticum]